MGGLLLSYILHLANKHPRLVILGCKFNFLVPILNCKKFLLRILEMNVPPHSETSMSYESKNLGIYFNLLDVDCFLSVK